MNTQTDKLSAIDAIAVIKASLDSAKIELENMETSEIEMQGFYKAGIAVMIAIHHLMDKV